MRAISAFVAARGWPNVVPRVGFVEIMYSRLAVSKSFLEPRFSTLHIPIRYLRPVLLPPKEGESKDSYPAARLMPKWDSADAPP